MPPDDVPEYASPGLREDVSNLPPSISFVGTLEPFKDELVTFMNILKAANCIPINFKVFEGGFMGLRCWARPLIWGLKPTTSKSMHLQNITTKKL